MKLSLCLTNFNRTELLLKSFEKIINDSRIDEVIIVDDCSDIEKYRWLQENCRHPKIKLFRNGQNLGMSLNKCEAIKLASNNWCILFDSDNVMDVNYLDALERCLSDDTPLIDEFIYCPDFARPNFDYTKYAGRSYDRDSAGSLIKEGGMAKCLLNTCNFIVNRNKYLEVYKHNEDVRGADTIWFLYLWFAAGNSIYVVPGMQYDHLVHKGSEWLAHAEYNRDQVKSTEALILSL